MCCSVESHWSVIKNPTHIANNAAGSDGVIETQPALIVRVLPRNQHILVAHVVWSLIDYPESSFHSDGVAVSEVREQVARVIVTLMESTLEVSLLVKSDLEERRASTI